MKLNILFCTLFLVILLNSCKKDSDPILPDFPVECDYDIGTYEYLTSSLATVPYEGKHGVVFVDSLGNQIHFEQSELLNDHNETFIQKYNPNDETEKIYYCYYQDSKLYLFSNDSLDLSFSAKLAANPYRTQPLKGYVADQLSLSLSHLSLPLGFYSSLSVTIDQRSFPEITENLIIPVYECFGKTFYQVQKSQYTLSASSLYYTSTEGVIQFKDETGKTWCFDHFD